MQRVLLCTRSWLETSHEAGLHGNTACSSPKTSDGFGKCPSQSPGRTLLGQERRLVKHRLFEHLRVVSTRDAKQKGRQCRDWVSAPRNHFQSTIRPLPFSGHSHLPVEARFLTQLIFFLHGCVWLCVWLVLKHFHINVNMHGSKLVPTYT